MKRKVLSMFPYYGGKARMAPLICDMLDYDHTDIFITPFGGACRELLNKKRHESEIYGDLSDGLCTFVYLMSRPQTAKELIYRIQDTEYSQKQFDKALLICDYSESEPLEGARQEFCRFFNDVLSKQNMPPLRPKKFWAIMKENRPDKYSKFIKAISQKDAVRLAELWDRVDWLERNLDEAASFPTARTFDSNGISDYDLAVATYVKYTQSRDAMGKAWSATKYKTDDAYYKQMGRLFEVADRLAGVGVLQMDAYYLYRSNDSIIYNDSISNYLAEYSSEQQETLIKEYYSRFLNHYIDNPRVMMYCDPSYIDPESEQVYLKKVAQCGKDVDAIRKIQLPKNLGVPYTASFNYNDQREFLRNICHAKCKLIISNYDLVLYNQYLNADNGWERVEYKTHTSVGGKKDNDRTEVLWYNY